MDTRTALVRLGSQNTQMGPLALIWDGFVPRYFTYLARRIRAELSSRLILLREVVDQNWGDPNFPGPLDLEIIQIMQDIDALEDQVPDVTWGEYAQ